MSNGIDGDLPNDIDQTVAPRPVGSEFIPVPGKLATPEQIGDFWIARGEWDESDKAKFVERHDVLEKNDPEAEKRERALQTEGIREALRPELASKMSPSEITDRYEAIGMSVAAAEFEKGLRSFEVTRDTEGAEEFRLDEGVKVLRNEDRVAANAYHRDQAEAAQSSDRKPDERSEQGEEMTPEQQAKLDSMLNKTFREKAREITGRDDGRSSPGLEL